MSGGSEKRTYQRVTFLCRVDLATDRATFEANTVDISLGGAGVASPRFVAAGRAVTLAFHLRDRRGEPAVERVDAWRSAWSRGVPETTSVESCWKNDILSSSLIAAWTLLATLACDTAQVSNPMRPAPQPSPASVKVSSARPADRPNGP